MSLELFTRTSIMLTSLGKLDLITLIFIQPVSIYILFLWGYFYSFTERNKLTFLSPKDAYEAYPCCHFLLL